MASHMTRNPTYRRNPAYHSNPVNLIRLDDAAKKAKVNKKIQRVNIAFPIFLLVEIDREARKIGVARSALIKLWLSEKLKHI